MRALPLSIAIALAGSWAAPGAAQLVPDATLPDPTTVTPNGSTFTIEGGLTAGPNLFHSFAEFSLPTDAEAFFNNAVGIDNILTRVTGGQISVIDGTLRANGTANLFLLNPAGLVFGANARLDLGGSFVGTTAERLEFVGGTAFSAVETGTAPLLTVSVPIGLQFGRSPGKIRILGPGNGLEFDAETDAIARDLRPSGLSTPGRTLALAGGAIELAGGNVTAEGGRVEIASVAEDGAIALNPDAAGFRLDVAEDSALADARLQNAASIDTSNGGSLRLHAQNLTLADGSAIVANVGQGLSGGTIELRASGAILLSGLSDRGFGSLVVSEVDPDAVGNAGAIAIETGRLQLEDGARISTSTFGRGDGGTAIVRATDSITLLGLDLHGDGSGITSIVSPGATGNAGNITIETGRLSLDDGATIATLTRGIGDAGDLTVRARESIDLRGLDGEGEDSNLESEVDEGGVGTGGNLLVETQRLALDDGAGITAATSGSGNAGNALVRATESIVLRGGDGDGDGSNIESTVDEGVVGNGGSLTVETGRLTLDDGASISTSTFGNGNAGDLVVRATETIVLRGEGSEGTTSIQSVAELGATGTAGDLAIATGSLALNDGTRVVASTAGRGTAGDLRIDAERLTVRNGAQVSAFTAGSGNAGSIEVRAGTIELSGTQNGLPASIDVDAFDGLGTGLANGAGGNATIVADRLVVRDGAVLGASNFGTRNAGRPGNGPAGSVEIIAPEIVLDGGRITVEAAVGDRGNLSLTSNDLRLRRNSTITASAFGEATGGNIAIATDTLVALENSDITANAQDSFGGRIAIAAPGIFGTQFRSFPTSDSDITATSALGAEFSGTVEINEPEIDSAALVELPENPIDIAALFARDPCSNSNSEFYFLGRGGIPPSPMGETIPYTPSNALPWINLQDTISLEEGAADATLGARSSGTQQREPIVEATAWEIDNKGNVALLAVDRVRGDRVRGDRWHRGDRCDADR